MKPILIIRNWYARAAMAAALLMSCTMHLHAQDNSLRLWYKAPATKWTEALPIGNGRLGAMIFGGVEEDRIQFNEETLWTGGPRDYHRTGAAQYLDTIRRLLFAGKQKEAELLAEQTFMGRKSFEGEKDGWVKDMTSLKGMNGNPAAAQYDDRNWKTMRVPAWDGWESVGFEGLDGAVWLRKTFTLPENWRGRNLVLDLNRIRDHDFTYVNGKLVGSMESNDARRYIIPKEALHAGTNVIAIQVLNYGNKGGLTGYKDTTRHIGMYPEDGSEAEKISLQGHWKYFIQSDEPPPVGHYQADYQPFGDLWLRFPGHTNVTGYERALDISRAIATTTYTVNGIRYTREYIASAPNDLIAVQVTADRKGSVSFEAVLNSPHKYAAVKKPDNNTLSLSVRVRNGAMRGESYLQVMLTGGSMQMEQNKIVVKNADAATIWLTAGTNYKSYKDVSANPAVPCTKALRSVAGKTYDQVKEAHVKEYQQYFNTFSIHFDGAENAHLPTDERLAKFAAGHDASFAALYVQYGRYLLIASSRPGTRPANLQGIWNDLLTPPWGSKYTTNINVEMNYWPAELLNLSPMHEPLFDMIKDLSEAGSKTAQAHYHAPGWVLHHNTDLWRGTAPINAADHGIWVTGGAWLCHHLWEHYLFTQDKQFLRERAYPIIKEAARFFNAFLIPDPRTGWLISTPSNSPEQGGLVAGPAMDHQLIRSLFTISVQAGELLGTDKSFRDSLTEKIKRIAPNQVGKFGQLQEWLEDVDDTSNRHRHVSHLWGVYPGYEINWDATPDLMKAARQSLIYRGDGGTGWSLGWKINLWARFKDGEHTYKMVKTLLSPAGGSAGSYPNLFDAHPPFQIDGNFGGAAGIGEMLVQSHTQYIDLLPALPTAFATGEVKGICVRGGFELNMKWKNGRLEEVEVLSKAGKACWLRYDGRTIKLPTKKGERYKLNGNLERKEV